MSNKKINLMGLLLLVGSPLYAQTEITQISDMWKWLLIIIVNSVGPLLIAKGLFKGGALVSNGNPEGWDVAKNAVMGGMIIFSATILPTLIWLGFTKFSVG
jgi:hypothetical protein